MLQKGGEGMKIKKIIMLILIFAIIVFEANI